MSSRYSTCIICHHPVVEIAGRWYHIATSTIPTQMCDSPTAKPIEHGSFSILRSNPIVTTVAATGFKTVADAYKYACAYLPDGQHYYIENDKGDIVALVAGGNAYLPATESELEEL